LVTQNYQLKIADLGTARLLAEYEDAQTKQQMQKTLFKMRGTSFYVCPELIMRDKATPKSDVYSYGVILYELIFRVINGYHNDPFTEFPNLLVHEVTLFKAVAERHVRPTIPATCPEPAAALIRRCWAHDPDDRPTSAELLEQIVELQVLYNQDDDEWDQAITFDESSDSDFASDDESSEFSDND
jgi:serine/threonine protein kinase